MSNFVDRTGEIRRATNGMLMEVIRYGGYGDIDVRFDDGTIVYNRSYGAFKKGLIKYPSKKKDKPISKKVKEDIKDLRVGEVFYTKSGKRLEVVNYNSHEDIDVKSENGELIKGVRYQHLVKGNDVGSRNMNKYLKSIIMANAGIRAKIIAVKDYRNVDILFEDGTKVSNKRIENFKIGKIPHPAFYAASNGKHYSKKYLDFTDLIETFKAKGSTFYYCTDKDGVRQVMTPQKMMEKSGIKPVF